MKPEVLVHHPIRPRQMEQLEAAYRLHRLDLAADADAALDAAAAARAIVTGGERPLGPDLLDRLPQAKLVATMSVGTDAIDLAACRARGVAVTNTPDVLTDDVADTALMLVLASARRLVEGHAHVRSGAWASAPLPLTRSLTGARAGVAGFGRIGQAIARRCAAVGMEVGYFARGERDSDFPYFPDLVALAGWADVLVLALPGGPGTRNMVGADVLAALGPEGTLVNVARGSVVDEPELIAALTAGRLGNAALDVFWNEPTPDPALTGLPNVLCYPHHASGTERSRDAMAELVVANLGAYFAGRPLLTPVA